MAKLERRQREREERRQLILAAARDVVSQEGINGLSIRKIAAATEYSPAMIYSYFSGKDEIVGQLLNEGYSDIMRMLGSARQTETNPRLRIASGLRSYILMAVKNSEYFGAFLLSDSPQVLARTGGLHRGATRTRPSLMAMQEDLRDLMPGADADDLELMSQIIWASLFGITTRLLMEKDVADEQKERLITRFVDFVLSALPGDEQQQAKTSR